MTGRAAVLALVLLAGPAGLAEPADAGDRDAVRGVIEAQLAAFARDDAEAAFGFASPEIQARFGDPETFIDMVRAAYRPVYRPAAVRFLDLDRSGARPVQKVLVTAEDDTVFLALYVMQRQANGGWRIAGCVLSRWEGGRAA